MINKWLKILDNSDTSEWVVKQSDHFLEIDKLKIETEGMNLSSLLIKIDKQATEIAGLRKVIVSVDEMYINKKAEVIELKGQTGHMNKKNWVAKYSTEQISLLNHEHLESKEWARYSDYEDMVHACKQADKDAAYWRTLAVDMQVAYDLVKLHSDPPKSASK